MKPRIWLCAVLSLLPVRAYSKDAGARAPGPATTADATCVVRSMHGQQKAGDVDKRLAFLRRQLTRPPFQDYKTIRLLSMKSLALSQGGVAQRTTLPTGKVLALTFKERLLSRTKKVRLRLHLSITPPQSKRQYLRNFVFNIGNRGTLLVAGEKLNDGILIVGITCRVR